MRTQHKVNGFTLIEVLIVVAIIGILMVLVLPSYNRHTLKANRSDAYAALNEIMQAQERFAADNGTYTVDLTAMGYLATQPSERGRFNITAGTCGATVIEQCVLLSAAAQGAQAADLNNPAGTTNIAITLDSRGARSGW